MGKKLAGSQIYDTVFSFALIAFGIVWVAWAAWQGPRPGLPAQAAPAALAPLVAGHGVAASGSAERARPVLGHG